MKRKSLLCLALIALVSQQIAAQSSERKIILGFGANLGVSQTRLKSNIAEIDELPVTQEGGILILTAGTPGVRLKVGGGFFYSSSGVPQTVDLIRLNTQVEIHPLDLIKKRFCRWSPYVIAAVSRNQHRFYGLYNGDAGANQNYSVSAEPYLGQVTLSEYAVGGGLSYQVSNLCGQFLHVFAEYKDSSPFARTGSPYFDQTSVSGIRMISIGFAIGKIF